MKYAVQHEKAGEEVEITVSKPWVMMYDTQAMGVVNYQDLEAQVTSLLDLKAVLVNTLSNFVGDYQRQCMAILEANGSRASQGMSSIPKDVCQQTVSLNITRQQQRLEIALNQICAWNGDNELTIILPYGVAPEDEKAPHIIGKPRLIDVHRCDFSVQGMLFVANWHKALPR